MCSVKHNIKWIINNIVVDIVVSLVYGVYKYFFDLKQDTEIIYIYIYVFLFSQRSMQGEIICYYDLEK